MKTPNGSSCLLLRRVIKDGFDTRQPPIKDLQKITRSMFEKVRRMLPHAQAILDPYMRMDEHTRGHVRHWEQFKAPFRDCWVESMGPEKIRVGALISTEKIGDDQELLLVHGFSFHPATAKPIACAFLTFLFDKDGAIVNWECSQVTSQPTEQENAIQQLCMMHPILLTVQIVNSPTVALYDLDHDNATTKTLKRAGNREPTHTYKTLTLKPTHSPRKKKGDPETTGQLPEFAVRGTWAEYGPKYKKGLLFGLYEGKVWKPDHKRGDRKNGTVTKTYKVGEKMNAAAVEAAEFAAAMNPVHVERPAPQPQEAN